MNVVRVLTTALLAILAIALTLATEPPRSTAKQSPVVEGTCDVDGVTVGWRTGSSQSAMGVTQVEVGEIAPTCTGANLTVTVSSDAGVLSNSAPVRVSGTTALASFTSPVDAEDITSVSVRIAGGDLPIPASCSSIKLNSLQLGTNRNDTLNGTSNRDLMFGMPGNDSMGGANGEDCLTGGSGDDSLSGGQGNDVLLGDAGNDVLRGEAGNNVLDGGSGTDTCYAARRDRVVSCEQVIQS